MNKDIKRAIAYRIIFLGLVLVGMSLFTGCADNSSYVIRGHDGLDGINGSDGEDGLNSLIGIAPATSCSAGGITVLVGLDLDRDNTLDSGEVQASSDICNGTNAPPTPYTPTGLVDPCGDSPGIHDEVFIRLQNNTLLASFSDSASGLNTRFSVLTPGTYQTTDGSHCTFTVDSSFNLTNEHF